ncbi:MAG: hypothetical protein QXG46_05495 [Ignisphaera sp.]|uniref:DNA primase large subunit PriL n=1 Tax=Ignisphaera aggregans TaxID=334771 RepID=A0A7C4D3S3_9CREN
MDKVLNVLLKVKSCEDLINIITDPTHYPQFEFDDLIRRHTDYSKILQLVFQGNVEAHDVDKNSIIIVSDSMYLLLAAIAIILGDPYISRFSLHFSKTYKRKILEALDDENIVLRSGALGLNIEYRKTCFKEIPYIVSHSNTITSICYKYRIPIYIYLNVAQKLLTESSWKLSAFPMHKGYIYIDDREKVLRLISEGIYNITSSRLRELRSTCTNLHGFRENLLNLIKTIHIDLGLIINEFLNSATKKVGRRGINEIDTLTSTSTTSLEIHNIDELISVAQTLFPPCIRKLIEDITKGENLSHHQRFALATFLINIGINLDIIVKLFSYSPDFNEKITRYQIEHLAGLKGSKKKYLVYSCDTMKTLGMCKAECNIKNPLVYTRKLLNSSSRKNEIDKTKQ